MKENVVIKMPSKRQQLFEKKIESLPKYLTSEELAHVLGVSVHTIRSWRKFRMIAPKVFGRSVRWQLDEVIEELSQRSKKNAKS